MRATQRGLSGRNELGRGGLSSRAGQCWLGSQCGSERLGLGSQAGLGRRVPRLGSQVEGGSLEPVRLDRPGVKRGGSSGGVS